MCSAELERSLWLASAEADDLRIPRRPAGNCVMRRNSRDYTANSMNTPNRSEPDLATFLASFDPDPGIRGRQWEHVCQWFLESDPVYRARLKKVWRWAAWPGQWGPDAGIDLVAEAHDGTVWAIQAKAYAPTTAVTKADMDSFLSESARVEISHRVLIATTSDVSAAARRASAGAEKPVSMVLRHDLDRREGWAWPASYAAWERGHVPTVKPKTPRPHQERALRDTVATLAHHDRGQVLMACGTGKTLVALWLHERLSASRTLVLVPSLSLLGQTLRQWVGNAAAPFETLPVCSDDTVRQDESDALVASTLDLGYPSTTDPAAVRAFVARRGPRVVFATYQSSPVIAAALHGTDLSFDLVIADEAHRCAGAVQGAFATVLDPAKILARRRVFLTATPRVYTARVVQEAREDDLDVASMDDEAVFGPVCHRLTFADAIAQGLLSDYRVVIVGIDDARYHAYATEGRLVSLDGQTQTDARTVAAHIGLAKAMQTYNLTRMLSFHGRVKGATAFAKALPAVIEWMPPRDRPSGRVWADAVSGAMSSGDRDTRLNRLRAVTNGERGLLSNARCLGEGVDLPTLDGLAFIDPKQSQVDIVQAVGRAIRPSAGMMATIVIPVFVDGEADGEAALEASAYQGIASVLRALKDHDARLAEELDAVRRDLGARPTLRQTFPSKIVLDLPQRLETAFSAAIEARLIQLTTSSWEEGYGHLTTYVQANGDARVAPLYRTAEGYRLGQWVSNQRQRRDSLSPERRVRLEAVAGWVWDPFDSDWDEGYGHLTTYVQAKGDARVPQSYPTAEGYPLGQWVSTQRQRRDSLSAERCAMFEALAGWFWDPLKKDWDEGYGQLTTYTQAKGDARVPKSYRTAEGYRLGAWAAVQRGNKDSLSPERHTKLEALPGWVWDPLKNDWDEGYGQLTTYTQAKGDARVSSSYRTAEGYRLGQWAAVQRRNKDSLSPARRARLEALAGWVWRLRA